MDEVSKMRTGETILFTDTVYLTWLKMLWSDARVQLTSQRLLWEPFENFPCELPLDQVKRVSHRALVVMTRTVVVGVEGTEVAIMTRGGAFQAALEAATRGQPRTTTPSCAPSSTPACPATPRAGWS